MNLQDIHKGIRPHKKRRRVGRGPGSGHGKTSGRGHKGQGQLAGWTSHPTFQGGQMPVVRRIPKRGFNNQWAKIVANVNVGLIDRHYEDGDEVSIESLRKKGLAKGRFDVLKILGDGTLSKRVIISAHRFSKSALEKIKEANGEARVITDFKRASRSTAST